MSAPITFIKTTRVLLHISLTSLFVPHLLLGLARGLFLPHFPNRELYAFLFYLMRAKFPAHTIFDLIILILLGWLR
jgi:hypothetical protein